MTANSARLSRCGVARGGGEGEDGSDVLSIDHQLTRELDSYPFG